MNLASLALKDLEERGEYPRLLFQDRNYTNRELHDASCRLSRALERLGVVHGDRVVVMMPNCPEVMVSYPAIWRVGGTVIPVLFVLDARELAYILHDSAAKVVITSPDVYPKVREASRHAPDLERVIVTGSESGVPEGGLSFDELVRTAEPLATIVERDPSDLANILYTSGTTGQPKGVMQTHHNLHAYALNSWKTSARREGERSLLVLPLAHSFGLGVLVSGYLFGGTAVLMRWFNPEEALALIQEHQITAMAGVPTMFMYMLTHERADRYDTSSVKRWLVGAAPMPVSQIRQFEAKFGGTMYVGYGLTESCPGIAVEREGMPRKPGSTGVPMEGVRVKIVGEDGAELPRGQIGEICASGENISPGYYKLAAATAETFRDGWLHTGDMGYLDEDDYLFIVERKKDLIIRAGLNVYPKDVEEIIYRHPAVREAAVVGVPDALMGEEVCAFIVPKSGARLTPEDVISHCQASLAKYKTPRYVEFASELPKTNIGKIQKKELRKLAAQKWAH